MFTGKPHKPSKEKGNENFLLMENNKFTNALLSRAQAKPRAKRHNRRIKNLSAARNLLAASNLRLFRAKLRCDIPVNPLQIERINYDYEFRLTRKALPARRRRERRSEIETRVEHKAFLNFFPFDNARSYCASVSPQGHIQSEPQGYRESTRHSQLVRRQMVLANTRKFVCSALVHISTGARSHPKAIYNPHESMI